MFINDNIKFLENTKQGFKRTISWNKYISYITTQPKNNSLGNLIGPAFRKINRFFVLSFKNGDNDPTADSFDKYYMSLVEIKDFNALISNKPFFDSKKASKKQTRSVWKTYWNVKKWWLYNGEFIRFFISSKLF